MNTRALTLLISAALFGAAGSAVAQSTDTYEHGAPPPVDPALAAVDGNDGFVSGDELLDPGAPKVRTQSPPNDPTLASRRADDAEVDVRAESRVVIDDDEALADADYEGTLQGDADELAASAEDSGRTQDSVDYAEQPIAGDDLDSARQTPDVIESEGTPFAETAGSEGFSEGATASNAEQRFARLDTNNDGTLSEQEASGTRLGERYAAYDINGDGTIASNEFQSYFAAQNWLEGDEQLPRDSGLATVDQDDVVDEPDADMADDAELDADLDVDVDSDIDDD